MIREIQAESESSSDGDDDLSDAPGRCDLGAGRELLETGGKKGHLMKREK